MLKSKRTCEFLRKSLVIKMVVGGGFEPPKAMLADLQSAALSLIFAIGPVLVLEF